MAVVRPPPSIRHRANGVPTTATARAPFPLPCAWLQHGTRCQCRRAHSQSIPRDIRPEPTDDRARHEHLLCQFSDGDNKQVLLADLIPRAHRYAHALRGDGGAAVADDGLNGCDRDFLHTVYLSLPLVLLLYHKMRGLSIEKCSSLSHYYMLGLRYRKTLSLYQSRVSTRVLTGIARFATVLGDKNADCHAPPAVLVRGGSTRWRGSAVCLPCPHHRAGGSATLPLTLILYHN